MVPIESLKRLAFFKESSDSALQHLSSHLIERQYEAEDLILKEGQQSDAIYIIAAGEARVEKNLDKEGVRTKVVAKLEREEIFGEMSFLEKKPLSASVYADSDMTVYSLQRMDVENLAKTDSGAALDQILTIFSSISRRLRRTTTELVTVFEVARLLMKEDKFDSILRSVFNQLALNLGADVPLAFYRWNPFNDEFDLAYALSTNFPANFTKSTVEQKDPAFHFKLIQFGKNYEGMIVFSSKTAFDSGAQQMIDTVSGLLAPALSTWRLREEEEARIRFESKRQEKFYS